VTSNRNWYIWGIFFWESLIWSFMDHSKGNFKNNYLIFKLNDFISFLIIFFPYELFKCLSPIFPHKYLINVTGGGFWGFGFEWFPFLLVACLFLGCLFAWTFDLCPLFLFLSFLGCLVFITLARFHQYLHFITTSLFSPIHQHGYEKTN
jgi:hypothetical protein